MLFLTLFISEVEHVSNSDRTLPLTPKTKLPQATSQYINHETLQYKRFYVNVGKKAYFFSLNGHCRAKSVN